MWCRWCGQAAKRAPQRNLGALGGSGFGEKMRRLARMPFRVFLSYSLDAAEIGIAFRLQSLAAAYGIQMYVPRYDGDASRLPGTVSVDAAIQRSDCVLAIIAVPFGAGLRRELAQAGRLKKPIIPIVEQSVLVDPAAFPTVFRFRRGEVPGALEAQVFEHFQGLKLTKEKKQAFAALAALGLGLIVLSSLEH